VPKEGSAINAAMHRLELHPFRFRDPLTCNWVRARSGCANSPTNSADYRIEQRSQVPGFGIVRDLLSHHPRSIAAVMLRAPTPIAILVRWRGRPLTGHFRSDHERPELAAVLGHRSDATAD